MNRKLIVLITTSALLTTSIAVAGCLARKSSEPATNESVAVQQNKILLQEIAMPAVLRNLILLPDQAPAQTAEKTGTHLFPLSAGQMVI